jgi:hypothetical protein
MKKLIIIFSMMVGSLMAQPKSMPPIPNRIVDPALIDGLVPYVILAVAIITGLGLGYTKYNDN